MQKLNNNETNVGIDKLIFQINPPTTNTKSQSDTNMSLDNKAPHH